MQIVLEGNNIDFLKSLEEFIKSQFQTAIVIGIPGIGKTYICKYFANNHGLSEQYYNLANFLFKQNTRNEIEQRLLQIDDNKIIFFDEWEHCLSNNYNQDIQMYLSRILQICQNKNNKIICITQSMDVNRFQWKFDQILKLELPSYQFRFKLIQQLFAKNEQILQILAQLTENYTPAEISTIIRQIQIAPLRKFILAKYHKLIEVDGKQMLVVANENDQNQTQLDIGNINKENILLEEQNLDEMIEIVKEYKPLSLQID